MANPLKKIYGTAKDVVTTTSSNGSSRSQIPDEVLEEVEGAFRAIAGQLPIWEQAMAFFNNDQYTFISAATGNVDRAETREGGAKAPHVPRLQTNRMTMQIVSRGVAFEREAAGLRGNRGGGPRPAGPQPGAARRAGAARGAPAPPSRRHLPGDGPARDQHGRRFTMPYWDYSLGQYLGVSEDQAELDEGDICVPVFHQGEVLWKVGQQFNESRWVCVRKAMDPESVMNCRGTSDPLSCAQMLARVGGSGRVIRRRSW